MKLFKCFFSYRIITPLGCWLQTEFGKKKGHKTTKINKVKLLQENVIMKTR